MKRTLVIRPWLKWNQDDSRYGVFLEHTGEVLEIPYTVFLCTRLRLVKRSRRVVVPSGFRALWTADELARGLIALCELDALVRLWVLTGPLEGFSGVRPTST